MDSVLNDRVDFPISGRCDQVDYRESFRVDYAFFAGPYDWFEGCGVFQSARSHFACHGIGTNIIQTGYVIEFLSKSRATLLFE
jgi:hypothetical protein